MTEIKKQLDGNKPIIFLGDHHGQWSQVAEDLEDKEIDNCYLISVGDIGVGFVEKEVQRFQQIPRINSFFKEREITFLGIRGNHDDPAYFEGNDRVIESHFELLEDYTVAQYKNLKIQFIGGAVSIDRTIRQVGVSYWEGEALKFLPDKCQEVDVLVTHTAPDICFPYKIPTNVFDWCAVDHPLYQDLIEERKSMSQLFSLIKPKVHVYGHFHNSSYEVINGCTHKLLNINEMWSCPILS